MTDKSGVGRRIVGFDRDDEGDWVALLECGHRQHVRHRPPWTNRPWVVRAAGRQARLGHMLRCGECIGGPGNEREER